MLQQKIKIGAKINAATVKKNNTVIIKPNKEFKNALASVSLFFEIKDL